MPKVYDNIHTKFADGLIGHLSSATRVDYCVGYFNLRGWNVASEGVDKLSGGKVLEAGNEEFRYCRLLVGMTKTPKQEIMEVFADPDRLLMGAWGRF